MRTTAAKWPWVLLCFSMVGTIGEGLYAPMVLTSLCSHTSEWRSFSHVQSRYHLA